MTCRGHVWSVFGASRKERRFICWLCGEVETKRSGTDVRLLSADEIALLDHAEARG